MSVTLLIIIVTGLVTYKAFQDSLLKEKLLFYPFAIAERKEYHRFLTHGFIHGDMMHVFFNLYVLYGFGEAVEHTFVSLFGSIGIAYYLVLYLGGIVASSLISYAQHKENATYRALGASGAVSAVMFSFILMYPQVDLQLMFIPIPIKGYVMGGLYLVYSHYMAKKQMDNIGHDAHFYGAVFGILITLVFRPDFMGDFIEKVF